MNGLLNKVGCLLLVSFGLLGCVEEFKLPRGSYQNVLVVDAMITDDGQPQVIKLSRTHRLDTNRIIVESGAEVSIIDNEENGYQFLELEPGQYFSNINNFVPKAGQTYMLQIRTTDGGFYQSAPVLMRTTPEIESINYALDSRPTNEPGVFQGGLQISVNTDDPDGKTANYLWKWEDVWEIHSAFDSQLEYDAETDTLFRREEMVFKCWKNSKSREILLATSSNLSSTKIVDFPLKFVPFNEPILRIKYSILVKQFSLSEESFTFWEHLKSTNETVGSLFDAQPFSVTGNIKNVNDPNEPVLGYFDAAELKQKRIFIPRSDLPEDVFIRSEFGWCGQTIENVPRDSLSDYGSYLIIQETFDENAFRFRYDIAPAACIDCRLQHAVNTKPDFWE
ncbi:DUF4249 domain-containing protein [Fulvivirgaceae bacterium BMA10]|uniref:DUF4249 domain-containing protein n=1 Tax=Splendidivirga corallicola TaxID=3051826 RepID=A0ABT8KU49_9BACT|nr:DUF4249 domain-containing protein [Fulvivirgaceae bacterium BMA10]